MASTLKEILESTRQLIAVKQAEFNTNLEGGVKSAKGLDMSGAGDDSPKTRSQGLGSEEPALTPQKKPLNTSDANAEPPSDGTGTTGKAEGKDESNVTDRTGTLGAEDSAPGTLTKKPLVSADVEAKVAADGAAKLANEILSDILNYRQTKAAAAPAPKAAVAPAAAPVPKTAAAPVAPKAAAAPAVAPKVAEGGPHLELTTDVLAKVAALLLSTEEGAMFVEGQLAKAAGAEAAEETLAFLAEQSELAEKAAAYDAGVADADALIKQSIYQAGVQAGRGTTKVAQAREGITQLVDQMRYVKLGQDAADASISDLMGAEGGAADGMAMDPAALGADPAAAGGGEMGGEEGITEEELAAALESLIQDGTIGPDEAQQVIEFITQGGEGGEMGGEAPAAEAPAAEAPAEEAPAEEAPAEEESGEGDMESEASAKTASLLAAIRKARSAKA